MYLFLLLFGATLANSQICDLSNQNLTQIPPLPCSLSIFDILILNGNTNLQISSTSFSQIKSITTLYLNNIGLHDLNISILQNLNISLLYLVGNPFNCPCNHIANFPPVINANIPICPSCIELFAIQPSEPTIPISVITFVCIFAAVLLVTLLPKTGMR